jgi:SNF2 family DNA or RNA helicase
MMRTARERVASN